MGLGKLLFEVIFNCDGSTQYWTVLYWKWEGNKEKSKNFTATVFSPSGSSGALCLRKRVTTSLKAPSSVVPGIQFYLLLSPYLCFISLLYLDLYVLGDDASIS